MKGFVGYSKEDSAVVERLMVHLKGLTYAGSIETWYDRYLTPGEEWGPKIRDELATADIIIFCVSADLLANEYVQRVEVPGAIARQDDGKAIVIPVILRPCDWQDHAFGKLQAIPAKDVTVDEYVRGDNVDEVWKEVTTGVRKAAGSLRETRHTSPSASPRSEARELIGRYLLTPAEYDGQELTVFLRRENWSRAWRRSNVNEVMKLQLDAGRTVQTNVEIVGEDGSAWVEMSAYARGGMARRVTRIGKGVLFQAKVRLLYAYVKDREDSYGDPLYALRGLGEDPVYRELMGFEVLEVIGETNDAQQPDAD